MTVCIGSNYGVQIINISTHLFSSSTKFVSCKRLDLVVNLFWILARKLCFQFGWLAREFFFHTGECKMDNKTG